MPDLVKLKAANARRWAVAQIRPSDVAKIDAAAKRLAAPDAKARYRAVSARTGVPWFVIAVIHEREASQSWRANIAQGDPWDEVSRHVPAGRGPFRSFEDAAVDALVNCAPHAARNTDWSAGGALTLLESYNGLGYAAMGMPSPYIWASTDQYVHGKYVADHKFDPTAVDRQIGCAALLKRMAVLDPSVAFDGTAGMASASANAPADKQPADRKPASLPARNRSSAAPKAGGTAKAAGGAAAAGAAATAAHQAGVPPGLILGVLLVAAFVIGAVLLMRKLGK